MPIAGGCLKQHRICDRQSSRNERQPLSSFLARLCGLVVFPEEQHRGLVRPNPRDARGSRNPRRRRADQEGISVDRFRPPRRTEDPARARLAKQKGQGLHKARRADHFEQRVARQLLPCRNSGKSAHDEFEIALDRNEVGASLSFDALLTMGVPRIETGFGFSRR
jgi:hypothetical protein